MHSCFCCEDRVRRIVFVASRQQREGRDAIVDAEMGLVEIWEDQNGETLISTLVLLSFLPSDHHTLSRNLGKLVGWEWLVS